MEIKNVVNETKLNYPELDEINNKKIKNCVPKKWQKIGMSSFVVSLLAKSKVFASVVPAQELQIYGMDPTLTKQVSPAVYISNFMQLASVLLLISFIISMICIKIKTKKFRFDKEAKILSIIIIVLFAISGIIQLLLKFEIIDYYI